MKDGFRYFPLPPEGVELARQYKDVQKGLMDYIEKLQAEYGEKVKAHQVVAQEQLADLWVKIANTVGVDAQESLQNPEWDIETRYINDGFAAILFYPRQPNPLLEAMGVPQEKEDEDDKSKGAPEGVKLN